jgi:hypothetical protein
MVEGRRGLFGLARRLFRGKKIIRGRKKIWGKRSLFLGRGRLFWDIEDACW